MDDKEKLNFLLIQDWRNKHVKDTISTEWVSIYNDKTIINNEYQEEITIYPILIPDDKITYILSDSRWAIQRNGLKPYLVEIENNKWVYTRYGDTSYEPLVLYRLFESHYAPYCEITEDFRLYHNLYFNTTNSTFIKFEAGVETEVIKMEKDHIRIHRKQLLQFLAAKQYHLVLQFEVMRFSDLDINLIEPANQRVDIQSDFSTYHYNIIQKNLYGFNASAQLYGKVVLKCPPIEFSGTYPYEEKEKFSDFIIGVDELGNDVVCSSSIDKVSYENGNFLKLVYFKRDVLKKYYDDSIRYQVGDGIIRKFGSWALRADTNREDYIVVFLGDLGRDLPYEEQLYWKTYNVRPPANRGLSEAQYNRSINGEFTEPINKEHLFKSHFKWFQEKWFNKFKWHLFKPLSKEDSGNYAKLHIPFSTNNYSEFDDLALALTKLLIDSINEEEIIKLINKDDLEKEAKSIKKFREFLKQKSMPNYEYFISFMEKLQFIRSSSSAHRKGSNFQKEVSKKGIDLSNLQKQFEAFLEDAIKLLEALDRHFLTDKS